MSVFLTSLENADSIPHKRVGVAIVRDGRGKILIARRLEGSPFGKLWEFPGGKIEPNETVEECIKREIWEELAMEVEVGEHLITLDHTYPHLRVTLIAHLCRHVAGEPQPIECDCACWIDSKELDSFDFPEANYQIIAALQNL